MKWGQERKMAVIVLIQTSKSHALPTLKSSLIPTGPSSSPRSSLLTPPLCFPSLNVPWEEGEENDWSDWLSPAFPAACASWPCTARTQLLPSSQGLLHTSDIPALPIRSSGGSRQASSISLKAGFPWQPSSSGQSYRDQIPALLFQGNFGGIP